jgi:ABC-type oligopeptide transport system ATPase subunit
MCNAGLGKNMDENIILSVSELSKHYKYYKTLFDIKKNVIKAVDGVSFGVFKNEIFAIVGETGCGKSTLSKLIAGLTEKTSGDIYFKGEVLDFRNKNKNFRKKIQILFQDPYSSLNPKKKIYKIVSYPAVKNGIIKNKDKDRIDFAAEQLKNVGLPESMASDYPHMLSGGQRQRVGIARCLSVNPELLILDEPVSALDVSISAQILNLLMDLQKKSGMSYMFITHDLKLVRHLADRVCVMYGGKIVEIAKTEDFFNAPVHPYSKTLMESMASMSFTRPNL